MRHKVDHQGAPGEASDRKPGAAPGLLVATEGSPPPRLDAVVSGDGTWSLERDVTLERVEALREGLKERQWLWLDVNGLGDAEVIAKVGTFFGLHRLGVEDALNPHQRPKTEAYEDVQFTVLQVPSLVEGDVEFEQVSLFLGERFLLTLQAKSATCLGALYDRFKRGAPRLTGSQVDYLFYASLDVLVDHDFPVLEALDERVEALEDAIFLRQGGSVLEELHAARSNVVVLRRMLWNQAMVPDTLIKMPLSWLREDTLPYLRDVQDHAHRARGLAEQLREAATGLFDLHNSMSGAQLNEVMKVLTIIATIFIPLTFIAGIYGMNFENEASPWNMPELQWRYGYLFAWGLMGVSALVMLWMFRRKGWIGGSRRRRK